jgi:NAD(P)-dependent dehydrogenase (short-subunit alcohol dehydrogenase family)
MTDAERGRHSLLPEYRGGIPVAISLRPIHDQVVVVVGATSGIGRETALRFAERGARLIVTARDEPALRALAGELRERGATAVEYLAGDVADDGNAPAIVDLAMRSFGRIDTWAHIAGVEIFATLEDTRPAEFRRLIEVNLLGVAYAAMAAVPILRQGQGGAFIAVSSVEADVPVPSQSAYAASKHGVDALLRTLRMELENEGAPVAVTQIQPYGIDTPLFRVALSRLDGDPKPAQPAYAPSVVAELIVHAAEHPERELFAGGLGWLSAMGQRYAPRLSEAVLARLGARMTAGSDPSLTSAPGTGNLFEPVPGTTSIRGGYGGRSFSVGNRLQMTPAAVRVAGLAAVVGLGVLAVRRTGD